MTLNIKRRHSRSTYTKSEFSIAEMYFLQHEFFPDVRKEELFERESIA